MSYRGRIEDPTKLGLLLQQVRLIQGLTQEDIARELGISQSYVSELESGKGSRALTRVFEFARLTGMTLHAEIPKEKMWAEESGS